MSRISFVHANPARRISPSGRVAAKIASINVNFVLQNGDVFRRCGVWKLKRMYPGLPKTSTVFKRQIQFRARRRKSTSQRENSAVYPGPTAIHRGCYRREAGSKFSLSDSAFACISKVYIRGPLDAAAIASERQRTVGAIFGRKEERENTTAK
ncbi:uncharacterized protein LOC114930916 [Nylanderia fulva]|uniref:uncharacterized protein LOC114930916 n=1 Tax=Nylanderia fulva TaxID=613905 RepID=UPI0010FB58CA|nr:uncharacterized protein LOC114930916 [Nylanderia fulva]